MMTTGYASAAELAKNISIVVACNDDATLQNNVMRSPLVPQLTEPVWVGRGYRAASLAYNEGLDATNGEIILFMHQDIYLPPCFLEDLHVAIEAANRHHPNWALLSSIGVTKDGQMVGSCWSTSQSALVGAPVTAPTVVESFDEMVIVMRRSAGLRFDEALPNYHFYGTDIVQMAKIAGYCACAVHLPVVHNDKFHHSLKDDFNQSYHFMRRKWRNQLPIRTTVLWIDRFGWNLWRYQMRSGSSIEKRRLIAGNPDENPEVYARQCGLA